MLLAIGSEIWRHHRSSAALGTVPDPQSAAAQYLLLLPEETQPDYDKSLHIRE